MRVFIAGVDGYLGWTLAQWLAGRGHIVGGADNFMRRDWVAEVGGMSATPIRRITERGEAFARIFGTSLRFFKGDLTDYRFVWNSLRAFRPDAIVHLGEMPSAPYSMIDVEHATFTHNNNLNGTLNILHAMRELCPDAHLVKLGTMGEYGTPNVDIPEGEFVLEFRGRKDWATFPRKPGSFYHATKVHDTVNVKFACDIWGLKSTDIMQGVVYGLNTWDKEAEMITRFDFDAVFGTAINRFIAQAIVDMPITPYGNGHQRRGFLPLQDSMQCLTVILENPPDPGQYRTVNQFEETYTILELAQTVQKIARKYGITAMIRSLVNPRIEAQDHYFNPDHAKLLELGYEPAGELENIISETMQTLIAVGKEKIEARKHILIPDIFWGGKREPAKWENQPQS